MQQFNFYIHETLNIELNYTSKVVNLSKSYIHFYVVATHLQSNSALFYS